MTVVGCLADGSLAPGVDGPALFASVARVFGSPRVMEAARVPAAKRFPWPSRFEAGIEAIVAGRDPVVVLATGDPMHFGVGGTLAERLPPEEIAVFPAPSAFSLAAARLKWRLEETRCVSLHRVAASEIARHVTPGARIIALTRDGDAPAEIAAHLDTAGFGASTLTVLENLGGHDETRLTFCAAAGPGRSVGALNTVAIECAATAGRLAGQAPQARRSFESVGDAAAASLAPGLPDEAFEHDGQLTKQDVRAITLAALRPRPGALLWDIGAGCGSVAIEWLRTASAGAGTAAASGAGALAFERDPDRLAMMERNSARLAPDLAIVAGEARETSLRPDLPDPDTVFLGGGLADEALFATAWERLQPAGTLVSNAVTVEGEAATMARYRRLGGTLVRIEISVSEAVGTLTALKPKMPVLQWRVTKAAA